MATPPVFTAGSVLTAAQMNAVGLWRITSCTVTSVGGTAATASNGVITVGTSNTSLTISNAFSADFAAYKIIYTGGVGSATTNLTLQLGSSATNYKYALNYAAYNNTPLALGSTTGTSINFAGNASANHTAMNLDLLNPFISNRYTTFNGFYFGINEAGTIVGIHEVNASYTAFTIAAVAGSLSGGTIRVYGYNN